MNGSLGKVVSFNAHFDLEKKYINAAGFLSGIIAGLGAVQVLQLRLSEAESRRRLLDGERVTKAPLLSGLWPVVDFGKDKRLLMMPADFTSEFILEW